MTNASLALTRHALREAFTGRRRFGLALLALAPALLGLSLRRWGPDNPEAQVSFVVFIIGVGLVVPLLALWIGVATLREELTSGTIVHLVTRPIGRAKLLVTRLGGAALATWLLAGVGLTLVFPAIGHMETDMLGVTWLVTGLASLAFTSLFALLGAAAFRRPVLLGLLYLVWDSLMAGSDLMFRKATIAFWVRSIVDQQGHVGAGLLAGEIVDPATTTTSVIALLAIAAVAGLIGVLWFQRREFATR